MILLFVFSLLVLTQDYGHDLDVNVKIAKTPSQLGLTAVPRTLKIQITDSSDSAGANPPQFDQYFDVLKVSKGKTEMVQWNTIRQEGD